MPYPDGTLFVDDVRDVSLVDGAFLCHVLQKANDYTFSTYLR